MVRIRFLVEFGHKGLSYSQKASKFDADVTPKFDGIKVDGVVFDQNWLFKCGKC